MRGVGQAVGDSRVSVQCRKSICEQCGREGQTVTDRGTGVRLLGRDQSRKESFSSPDDMGCTEVSSSCSNEIDDPVYLRGFS